MTDKKQLNLVLLGPPGAGKGTQAALLVKAFGLLHISTGDMLRSAIKEGTELGKEAQGYMNKGELVPDELVTNIVIERMMKDDAQQGVMLDGFPRTVTQAESLETSLKDNNKTLSAVLYFNTSEDVVIQRLTGRRLCKSCGKIFHLTNMPPKVENICDACGGELYQRDDDKIETVKNRLAVYESSTKDLLEYYSNKGLLKKVDGDISANKLFEDIKALFEKEGLI